VIMCLSTNFTLVSFMIFYKLYRLSNFNYPSLYVDDRIGDVIVSVLASRAVDRGFEPRLGQPKDYTIGICCFSAKHSILMRKGKDWLARNPHGRMLYYQKRVTPWENALPSEESFAIGECFTIGRYLLYGREIFTRGR